MRNQLITWCLAVTLIGLLSGCKKSEQPAGSNKGALLKIKWPAGNRYVYRMDLDQHTTTKIPQMPKPIQQHLTMALTYALSVLKETPEGGRELEMEFLATEMEINTVGQNAIKFNSKDTPTNEAPNPMSEPFRNMIGSKVRLEVNAEGRVTNVIGLEDWAKNIASDDPSAQMMTQQFNEGFFRQIADFGRGLSTKPVEIGNTWQTKLEVPAGGLGKIDVDVKTTLKGFVSHDQPHCAVLDTKGTLKGTPGTESGPAGNRPKMLLDRGQVTGTSWFDPELGVLIESTADQTMAVKGQLPGQRGALPFSSSGFTVDLNQKVSLKLTELGKTNG
jgi:hypothetical protein